MTGTDTTALAAHVRRLDRDALRALVADRGVDAAGGVDVVVAPRGHDSTPDGARVVDATALAEMLVYAVDPAASRDLCERHLGAPPAALRLPARERIRRRTTALLAGATPAVLLVLVLVLGVGALTGATILGGPSGGDAAADTGASGATDAAPGASASADTADTADVAVGPPTSADEAATPGADDRAASDAPPFPSSRQSPPPGVTDAGIADLDALAAAHDAALANRSHTVWLDRYRTPPNASRVQFDTDIAAEGGRYLVELSRETDGRRTRLGARYHTGEATYVARWDRETGRYEPAGSLSVRAVRPTPATVRRSLVRRYLATPRTNVTGRVEADGAVLYRVVGRGSPDSTALGTVDNYTVVALVDSRGFVRELEASYDSPTGNGTVGVRHTFTYDRLGTTDVEPPAWFQPVENGTAR